MTLFRKRISIRLTNSECFVVSTSRIRWFVSQKPFHVGLIPLSVAAMIRPMETGFPDDGGKGHRTTTVADADV
jgi:hypothetical protein